MTLRERLLGAVGALTPGQRDMFTWIILALAVVVVMGLVGVVVELEGELWKR